MNASDMRLRIFLPYDALLEAETVLRIVVETTDGALGILPHRLDCVASVVPGILAYEPKGGRMSYVAVDTGILVKAGTDVSLAVRRAVVGPNLAQLRTEVERHFLHLDNEERQMRTALARVERGLVQRFREVLHER